jgi:hypothetical protein
MASIPHAEHALISLLALNGLRVSEATGANIENLGVERGHRTLVITRKGGKVVTIPLAPRTARAIDLAVAERVGGLIFLVPDGQWLDRHGAARIVRRVARRADIAKPVGPHTLRQAFIIAALNAGVPLRDVQEAASHTDPRTMMRYAGPGPPSTATPPTSSRPISLVPPGKQLTAQKQTPPGRTTAARGAPSAGALGASSTAIRTAISVVQDPDACPFPPGRQAPHAAGVGRGAAGFVAWINGLR